MKKREDRLVVVLYMVLRYKIFCEKLRRTQSRQKILYLFLLFWKYILSFTTLKNSIV